MTSQVMDRVTRAGHHGPMFNPPETSMSLIASLTSPQGLRRVLWADVASGAAMAALHLAMPDALGGWLGLPAGLLGASGALVLPFVLLAAALAMQSPPHRLALGLLVLGNMAWVVASLWLLLAGPLALTGLGQAYIGVQALAVLVLAELQWMGGRRLGAALHAAPAH